MPTFIWEARTKAGEVRSGTFNADSEDAVTDRLRAQGLTITKVKRKPMELSLPSLGSGVGLKDMVVFTRTFSTMIDAGLPIVSGLEMLSNQAENPRFGRILELDHHAHPLLLHAERAPRGEGRGLLDPHAAVQAADPPPAHQLDGVQAFGAEMIF